MAETAADIVYRALRSANAIRISPMRSLKPCGIWSARTS